MRTFDVRNFAFVRLEVLSCGVRDFNLSFCDLGLDRLILLDLSYYDHYDLIGSGNYPSHNPSYNISHLAEHIGPGTAFSIKATQTCIFRMY